MIIIDLAQFVYEYKSKPIKLKKSNENKIQQKQNSIKSHSKTQQQILMNKAIFKKLKKTQIQSMNGSPYSQQKISAMSVNQIEKTLFNHMSQQTNQSPNRVNRINYNQLNLDHNMNNSRLSKDNFIRQKRIPELIFSNDQLKCQIEKLKNQKLLILSKYQQIQNSNKYDRINMNCKQNIQDFSFRKSVQNIQKIVSLDSHQKPRRQNALNKKRSAKIGQKVSQSNQRKLNAYQENRRSGKSLSSKVMTSNLQRPGSKQHFSTLQQRFYQYCKTQMVRMNTQNTKLTLKIGELQNKLTVINKQYQFLQQKNSKLQVLNQISQQKLKSQSEKIHKINGQMSIALNKKQQIIQGDFKLLRVQINQLRVQEDKLRKSLAQKDIQIMNLKADNQRKQKQGNKNAQLVSKNISLQNQLAQCINRNRKLNQKFRKIPAIDHLWQIKQVQYQNLLNLIEWQKQQNDSPQLDPNLSLKSSGNGLDLSFSKLKSNF